MKKTSLFFLAAGALALITLPLSAQESANVQQVQKEKQKLQTTQGVTNQTGSIKAANPAGVTVSSKPAQVNPGAAPQAGPQTPPAPPVPLTCTWDVTDYDFGKNVIQAKPASATFTITNAGKEPVTITLVQPSCGCTSPKYTKEPIKPGEKGEVVLTYDAKNSGFFSKSAQVKLNDGQKYMLTIKGDVQKVEATPAGTPVPTAPPVKK
jgi:hypothetical protein